MPRTNRPFAIAHLDLLVVGGALNVIGWWRSLDSWPGRCGCSCSRDICAGCRTGSPVTSRTRSSWRSGRAARCSMADLRPGMASPVAPGPNHRLRPGPSRLRAPGDRVSQYLSGGVRRVATKTAALSSRGMAGQACDRRALRQRQHLEALELSLMSVATLCIVKGRAAWLAPVSAWRLSPRIAGPLSALPGHPPQMARLCSRDPRRGIIFICTCIFLNISVPDALEQTALPGPKPHQDQGNRRRVWPARVLHSSPDWQW